MDRDKRINEMAEMIVDMVNCDDPMARFKTNQHVNTLDDLEWWAKQNLEKYCCMKARLEINGDEDDLDDFISGKHGVFDELVKNIKRVKEKTDVK